MSEQRINTYEAMYLFPQSVTANLTGAVDHIKSILSRGDAELISLRKWDERRLAYAIKGNKRGVYFLVYFKAPSDKMPLIERYSNLSEEILRAMITRADHIPEEQMQASDGQQQIADEAKLRASEANVDSEVVDSSASADDSDRETSYADTPGSEIRP